ncbi:hypothetical protein FOA52_003307 [Chlamydomonas sp. UWO 241]|nr:hypothetical protein FOA52_003307 [Chlamydomonas sp. UWO 241]
MEAGASTASSKDPWDTASFTWRIEGFSKLTSKPVRSDSFEAGICTWLLQVYTEGYSSAGCSSPPPLVDNSDGDGDNSDSYDNDSYDDVTGNDLADFLETQDDMWEPSAEYKITLVNQADASDSICASWCKFDISKVRRGDGMLIELSELRDVAAGFLINDTLVLTADVTVEREDRFQLDAGATPCDVTLKLPCGVEIPTHGQLLQPASPFFSDALEDMKANAPIPVTGSLGTWIYILSCLYPLHNQPVLTLGSVFTLLPVVHKFDFTKLLTRLVDFVKERSGELDDDPNLPARFVIRWLALAERLQLDELHELCLARLRGMSKEQR